MAKRQARLLRRVLLLLATLSTTLIVYHSIRTKLQISNRGINQSLPSLLKLQQTIEDGNSKLQPAAFVGVPGGNLNFLVSELQKKLAMAVDPEEEVYNMTSACDDLHIEYKMPDCQKGVGQECLNKQIPDELEKRIKDLTFRPNLQVPFQYYQVLQQMAAGVPGYYDILIVTALSSNHYMEAQALMKNLHETVFPLLNNFTFVVFDLGLKKQERDEISKYCRCTLLPFPFTKFPAHYRTIRCFSWKVSIIRAMYEKAEIVLWTDTSIRITQPNTVVQYIERARQRGIQQRFFHLRARNPYHTLPQMFHHFGDSPCAHMAFFQGETGYGIYHKEPLVQHAILDPWFGCAVRKECICPVDQSKVQNCPAFNGTKIGLCMRNEQSAISIILSKLFREKYRYFMIRVQHFQDTKRDIGFPYFDEQRKLKG